MSLHSISIPSGSDIDLEKFSDYGTGVLTAQLARNIELIRSVLQVSAYE